MTSLIEQARAAAAKLADQTEDKGGSFEYEPPAAGPCIARFISYVEIGNHPQKAFQGQAKPPAPEAIIQFELLGKKHAKEIETQDEITVRISAVTSLPETVACSIGRTWAKVTAPSSCNSLSCARLVPSTSTRTVPSGILSICRICAITPTS